MSKKELEARIDHEIDYIKFLEKSLNSINYKNSVSEEEYNKTKEKLKKSKYLLKFWQESKK